MTPRPWEGPVDRYPAPFRPTGPPIPLGNAGGLSGARLWRFSSAAGPLVLRCWPAEGPGRAELQVVHGWLARLANLPYIPAPIPALDGRSLVALGGRLWELAPWRPGRSDPARPPAPARVRAMFAALATVHRRLGPIGLEAPSPGLAARLAEVGRLLSFEFDSLAAALRKIPDDPLAPLAALWLGLARPLAPPVLEALRRSLLQPVPIQPVIRDARADHFLFEADALTGLVDFGAMGRDTVAADLARLLIDSIGPDRLARADALAAYESIRPLQTAEASLIPAFERANALLTGAHWARWHFLEGRRFDDPEAAGRGLRRGLGWLEESPRIEEIGRKMRDALPG